MINCGLCELHSAFSIVMVTIAHQLGTILTQEVLVPCWPSTSVRLARIVCSSEQAETGLPNNL
jgi:hypothetical protein